MKFKDHFSGHAADYAHYRPSYPNELFSYLAALAPNRDLAWDCATGNGQAAAELGQFFEHVVATDASEKQIASAIKHERVEYRVATAEASWLADDSVGLITVAQALHWFDLPRFFAEAERVLQRGGVLAVWTYNLCQISPDIDRAIEKFYRETVGPFWDFERKHVESGYSSIEFPFAAIAAPIFQMEAEWNLAQLLGYLRTWSATKGFLKKHGFDPVDSLGRELAQSWMGEGKPKLVQWPLSVIVRRKG